MWEQVRNAEPLAPMPNPLREDLQLIKILRECSAHCSLESAVPVLLVVFVFEDQ